MGLLNLEDVAALPAKLGPKVLYSSLFDGQLLQVFTGIIVHEYEQVIWCCVQYRVTLMAEHQVNM